MKLKFPWQLAAALATASPLTSWATTSSSVGAITTAASKSTDESRKALVAIFGSVVTNPLAATGAASDSIVASIFQTTNSVLLAMGGVLCGWTIFKRVASTANSGSFFDAAGQSVLGPLRMVWGLCALIPTANGWSIAQLVMLWAASVMGVGSANLAVTAVSTAMQNGTSMVLAPTAPETSELATSLYKDDLCMEAINLGLNEISATGSSVSALEKVSQVAFSDGSGFRLEDGYKTYSCGGAAVDASKETAAGYISMTLNWDTLDVSSIYQAQGSALTTMQASLDASARTFVNAVVQRRNDSGVTLPDAQSAIDDAANAYQSAIQTSVSGKTSDVTGLSSQMLSNLTSQGWWMLGSWYQTFAMANTQLSDAVNSEATVQGPMATHSAGPDEVWNSALLAFDSQQRTSQTTTPVGITSPSSTNVGLGGSLSTILKSTFNAPGQAFLKVITNTATTSGSTVNPLIALKNIGDYMMVMAQATIAGATTAQFALSSSDSGIIGAVVNVASGNVVAGIDGAYKSLAPYLVMVVTSCLFLGLQLSVYLPLVPFVIWFGAIVNWLAVVFEGVVAAPLWAMAHLVGDGEGMGQRSTYGYIFLLDLCIRPFLMVTGFFAGSMILVAVSPFLIQGFSVAVENAQFDSLTGIASVIGFTWVFTQMALALAHNCFNLILIVPDRALAWIGGQIAAQVGVNAPLIQAGVDRGISGASDKHTRAIQHGSTILSNNSTKNGVDGER